MNSYTKNKDRDPYEFFFLNESVFQEYIASDKEFNMSTIGYISNNDLERKEALLNYDNSILKVNLSRIDQSYKVSKELYMLYGILKRENSENVLYVNFYRNLSDNFDLDNYKRIIDNIRKIKKETENLS